MNIRNLDSIPTWEWPPAAAEIILTVLRDRGADPADRLLATELAGDCAVIDDRLAAALLAIHVDGAEPDEMRGQAAIALGPVLELTDEEPDEWSDPPIGQMMVQRIRKTLRQVYQNAREPKLVRRRALEAAIRAPEEWQTGAVRAAYADTDPEWRLTAVFCMGFIGGFEAQILDSLDNPDEDIHYHAVVGAGNWELEAAWDHVSALAAAASTDKDLRLAAIDAVASIHPEKAASVLGPLAGSSDEDIAEAVVEALEFARMMATADRKGRTR